MEEIRITIKYLEAEKQYIQFAITKPTEHGRWPSDNEFLALHATAAYAAYAAADAADAAAYAAAYDAQWEKNKELMRAWINSQTGE